MSASLAAFTCVLKRDLLLAARKPADIASPLVFFAIVVSLFPLGVSPEPAILRTLAPGVLWVAALLATLLSLNRLFAADYADGTLELLALSPQPLALLAAAKVTAHWLTTGLPLIILSPLLALQLALPDKALGTLLLAGGLLFTRSDLIRLALPLLIGAFGLFLCVMSLSLRRARTKGPTVSGMR